MVCKEVRLIGFVNILVQLFEREKIDEIIR